MSPQKLFEALGVDSICRFHEADFNLVETMISEFTHFNLGKTPHKAGQIFALLPIASPGRKSGQDKELLPVLDTSRFVIASCKRTAYFYAPADVPASYFETSLPTIENTVELESELVRRYAKLNPQLTTAEMLEKGVSATVFHIQ